MMTESTACLRPLLWPHAILGTGIVALATSPALAQCPIDWLPGEGVPGVVGNATVFASTVWDPDADGPQPPLAVFGGSLVGAGDAAVNSIAAWDGVEWHALGDGLNAQVRALTVHNGELVAAAGHNGFGNTGPANGVARWDATAQSWLPLGRDGFQNVVWALTVFEGELYAGGLFNSAGGTPVVNIARWNGSDWQPVGAGLPGGVSALTMFQGELLAGTGAGVRRWDRRAGSWETFGANLTGSVLSFGTYDGELIVGGSFQTVPDTPIDEVARWDGATWLVLGAGMNDSVHALIEYEGELIAGGLFTLVEGQFASRMARWDGEFWSPIPAGPGMPERRCDSFSIFSGDLYAGGAVTAPSGVQAEQVGRWNGAAWSYVGDGIDAIVYDFATFNGELIAGGSFSTAGDIVANGIARRDGAGEWHSMGGVTGGDGFISDLVVYSGTLIASGSFTAIDAVPVPHGVAQWDGEVWSAFGTVAVGKKLVHDGDLYAPGAFAPNQHVARWNPLTETWQPLGSFPPNTGITCLTIFDGDLVAGGIGGIGTSASVWRWDFDDPGAWQPVGQNLGFATVQTLAEYDGELLAGGYIDGGLARFNGTSWVTLGGGLFLGNESPDEVLAVFDLRVFNGDLIVAGTFSYAGNQQYMKDAVAAFHVASWNGSEWQGLGSGTNNAVVALHEHDDALVMGGWFDMAGGAPNGHWARWGPICAPSDIDGDGVVGPGDLAQLLASWGTCSPPQPCPPDLDGDGEVGAADLAMLLAAWE
jgi:hypothetical protein